jgi:hypothetical protein
MVIDRVTNLVAGTARPGTTVQVDQPWAATVPVDQEGNWIYDPNVDFTGNTVFYAHWMSSRGDRIDMIQFAPQLVLMLDKPKFQVFGTPNSQANLALTRDTANGQRVASMDLEFGGSGEIRDTFIDQQGHRMKLRPGDHVSAPDIASDADWIVPNIEARGRPLTNIVNGGCFDAGTSSGLYSLFVLDSSNNHTKASVWGEVNPDGTFSVDFDDPGSSPNVSTYTQAADVVSGERGQTPSLVPANHRRLRTSQGRRRISAGALFGQQRARRHEWAPGSALRAATQTPSPARSSPC